MKEQDFIHTINEKTKDLPIPDSISPENMKNMLDEHIKNTSNSDSGKSTFGTADPMAESGRHKRNTRRFVAAACVLLCLIGSLGIYNLSQLGRNTESAKDMLLDSGATNESVEETADAKAVEQTGDELAYQTSLTSPSSYDEYYDTLKAAYDEYYDNLSQVEPGFGIRIGSVEDLTDGVGIDMAEDGGMVGIAEESAFDDIAVNGADDSASYSTASLADNQKQMRSSDSYSTTNTQEQAVDEGDVIKTDGKYIYKLVRGYSEEAQDYVNQIFITEADNGNLSSVAKIDLDAALQPGEDNYTTFHEFYIYDDTLVGLYTKNTWEKDYSQTIVTYIVLYDLKDLDRDKDVKSEPKILKTFTQSGSFVSSRISDGYLYTISNFSETSLSQKKPYSNYIPIINGDMIDCVNIFYPKDILMETTYVVTSLDLSNPTDFKDEKAIPTKGGDTYVSDSSIYFYRTLYEDVTRTEIMKVSYDKGILTPRNNAVITGYLYDSFALSEYDNHLRIVAIIPANNIALLRLDPGFMQPTNGKDNTEVKEDVNALYILDDSMQLTGKLTGIAPGERIYSARFMGDIGYFVTYRNTDPLFSVDLSDPANPEIIGELKIPGFSNYLHFYDTNLLLGLGEETDPETLMTTGLKLSMFDISDPGNVQEKDKYIIKHSQYSEAQSNHKALMIDPVKNIFGFMFFGFSNYAENDYSYYYVTYTYDKKNGFTETARYRINDGSEYDSDAVRSVYIGDYLYLATNKSITSYEIGSTDAIAQVYYK